jgi:multidrug efflux pump subunit AcrA (membrane-fusion protein)
MLVIIRILFFIARLLILFLAGHAAIFAEASPEPPERASIERYPVIELNKEAQRVAGLETMEARTVSHSPEFMAYGKAVNLQPLLALKQQYLQALTDGSSARAKLIQSREGMKRVQDLLTHGVAPKRRLQEQQSQWRVDQSQVDASHYRLQTIVNEARLNWGEQLTGWAMTPDSGKLDAFLSGKEILLQITLPSNRRLAEGIRTIFVDASGNRGQAREAGFVSQAPQADVPVQGISYFFRTQAGELTPGMSVSAWIPEGRAAAEGVAIPKSAVIWSMDQHFVYIKNGEKRFSRRLLETTAPMGDGYFISGAILPGEQVVTIGGQLLLSEELRGRIAEDDD